MAIGRYTSSRACVKAPRMCPHPLGTTAPSSDTDHPAYESEVFGFVILWCKEETNRVGEVGLFVPFEKTLIGRGMPGLKAFLRFGRHRPGAAPVPTPLEWCLLDSRLSREQLDATATAVGIDMVVLGRCPTSVNGVPIAKGARVTLVEDDVVFLKDAVLLRVVRRKRVMPALDHLQEVHPFGKANSFGMVGESPAMWKLHDELALAASRHNHVLLLGETGSGKEAAARAIHYRSARAKKPFCPMNAAAISTGIFAAEVFGNTANFPSYGMSARDGLLPAAEDGTVFLDEVGGLSAEDQTKLFRAMESGEYHKLGESKARRLNATIVAATSSDPELLKEDFRTRFARRVRVPPVRERREDIVLLLRHLALKEAALYPKEMARFLERGPDGDMVPRVSAEFVAALMHHPLSGNVRDLYNFLLMALAESRGEWIEVPRELAAAEEARLSRGPASKGPSSTAPASKAPPSKAPPSSEVPSGPAQSEPRRKATREEVVAALEKAGSVQGAALLLGVPRRTLRNWMAEYGLRAPGETDQPQPY